MLRRDVGSTFSDIWYRVADRRPRLSPHAQVTRQSRGDHLAYVIEDPASSQFYRLTEPAYFFVGLLDGRRTVDEAWNACNAQLGDDAPTQRECIEVLSRLQLFGLLVGDMPLAADMVAERKAQARAQRIRRRTGMWMFWSIPLFNPEPFLERYRLICRALFSRWMGLVWIIVVLAGFAAVLANWQRLGSNMDELLRLDPRAIALIAGAFLFLRVFHELAHATSCKAMGGRSTEIGVIMIAGILPLPYCDATSAWRFEETWRRVLVSSAGMIVELFFAAIAAIVWATASSPLAQSVAYSVMIVASVTTILFNANPLLRYDGYYILSDVMDAPNLAARSREFWKFLVERYAFGVRGVRPPRIRDRREAWLLGIYGLLAVPYRLFISVSIILFIAQRYATLGAALAVIVAVVWLLVPLAKGLGHLLGSPTLVGRRARAVGVTALALGSVAILVGLVPMPAAGYATGTVEARSRLPLRSAEEGFVAEVFASPGDRVEAGQVILRLANPRLDTEIDVLTAQLDQALAAAEQAMGQSPAALAAARARIDGAAARLERAKARARELDVRAPQAGALIAASGENLDFNQLLGRFIPRGTLIGHVADTDQLVVRSLLPERDRPYVFRGASGPESVAIRLRGMGHRSIPARILRQTPAGSRELTSAALSTLFGGDILVDPNSRDRLQALSSYFLIEVAPAEHMPGAQPGLRARVRFALQPEPLLAQLWRRARQFFDARFSA